LGSRDEPTPTDSSGPHALFESRITQLEQELAQRTAELEAAKAQAGSSADLLKLKEQRNRQDREILRLKEELQGKERELVDLREEHTTLEHQVQGQKDEAVKREATAKALQQRADALAAAAKKFERELTAARKELEGLPVLRARIVEHEKERAELQRKVENTHADLDRAHARTAQLQEAHGHELQGAREMHATELAGAREMHATEVQELRGELEKLHSQVGRSRDELQELRAQHEAAKADAARLGGDLETVRAELTTLAGEKELVIDEREELKKALAESQAAAAQNEERAVKAYQKIKGDERLRERTRKALTIALQLLDEAPSIEALEEHVEAAKSA
jgi:chromosome segregation ATPase